MAKINCSRRTLRLITYALLLQLIVFTSILFFSPSARYKLRQLPYLTLSKLKGQDPNSPIVFPPETFIFNGTQRPAWTDVPPPQPLVIRLTIITRVDGFDRRNSLREVLLRGIPETDVKFEYKFVVGHERYPFHGKPFSWVDQWVRDERDKHGDMLILNMEESMQRMTEKRYRAMQWSGLADPTTYDYFMTLDDDTFCRLPALARRLAADKVLGKKNPRKEPILIGRSMSNWRYWLNTVPDIKVEGGIDETAPGYEDKNDMVVNGPWYEYPGGIGYMISSYLTNIFLHTDPPLPHHIPYPCDDVIIGSWMHSLMIYHKNETYEFGPPDNPESERHPVTMIKHTKEPVITHYVNDEMGWHNYPGTGQHDQPIGWESVCIHRAHDREMKGLRNLPEWKGEWVQ